MATEGDSVSPPCSGRLFSLDLLRGLDIFLLTAFGPVVKYGFFKVWEPGEWTLHFWQHSLDSFATPGAVPRGFGIWDFAQPLFIFVCGAAVPLAIPRRLSPEGRATPAFWRHVLGRVALLWTFGMLIRGLLLFDRTKFTPYSDTLQTIAVAYLGAALAMLIRRRLVRLALALAMIAAYGVLQACGGDYSQLGNISRIVDERVFAAIGCRAKDFCYVLTTVAWAAMGMLGALAGELLTGPRTPWQKVRALAGWGVASLALGWTLQIWIPPIRYIYTVSFIFTTFGYAILLLAALHVATDIFSWRRGLGLFTLFGRHSLAAWMLGSFFSGGLYAVADRLVPGFPVLLGSARYQPFVRQLAYAAVLTALLLLWHRLRSASRAGCPA